LAPADNLIVDAELARTKVTDRAMQSLANFSNLRFLDLSDTAVTSAGVKDLMKLEKLESLNLTQTKVTRNGATELQSKPGLKRLYCSKRTETCALKTQVCLPAPRARRFLGGLTFDPCKDEPTSGVSPLPVSTKM
jgi:hypothetical protein